VICFGTVPYQSLIILHSDIVEIDSTATNPGGLPLSESKQRELEPSMFGTRRVLRKLVGALLIVDVLDLIDGPLLKDHLANGDSRAAVVVATYPLLVAAYSDDLDCVAMLRFDDRFVARYNLHRGSQLVTINQYYSHQVIHKDLIAGPNRVADWSGFYPLIAEFLSDDEARVATLKEGISSVEWQHCQGLGEEYLNKHPGVARLGRPRRAHQPAGFMKTVIIGSLVGVLGIAAFIILAWKFL
jgi:hypothetical protein